MTDDGKFEKIFNLRSIGLIGAERSLQIAKGWNPEHDDRHVECELIRAAMCYARAAEIIQDHGPAESARRYLVRNGIDPATDEDYQASLSDPVGYHFGYRPPDDWPWEPEAWKPEPEAIDNLMKAGALIAAEIDRLQRRDG